MIKDLEKSKQVFDNLENENKLLVYILKIVEDAIKFLGSDNVNVKNSN